MEGPRASNNLGAAACNQPLLHFVKRKTAASHDANTYMYEWKHNAFRVVTVRYNIGLYTQRYIIQEIEVIVEPQFGVFSLTRALYTYVYVSDKTCNQHYTITLFICYSYN